MIDHQDTQLYQKGAQRIFWGFIFVLINIRIMTLDILPDFIGYFLVWAGLRRISELSEWFNSAQKYAVLLVVLSLPNLIQVQGTASSGNGFAATPSGIAFMALGGLVVLAKLFLVYQVCQGIMTSSRGEELEITARNRWQYFLYVNGAVLLLLPFTINLPNSMNIAFTLIVIPILFIAELLMVNLFYKFSKLMGLELRAKTDE